jgi:hypothetical protein
MTKARRHVRPVVRDRHRELVRCLAYSAHPPTPPSVSPTTRRPSPIRAPTTSVPRISGRVRPSSPRRGARCRRSPARPGHLDQGVPNPIAGRGMRTTVRTSGPPKTGATPAAVRCVPRWRWRCNTDLRGTGARRDDRPRPNGSDGRTSQANRQPAGSCAREARGAAALRRLAARLSGHLHTPTASTGWMPATPIRADTTPPARIRRLVLPLVPADPRRHRTIRATVAAYAALPVLVALARSIASWSHLAPSCRERRLADI